MKKNNWFCFYYRQKKMLWVLISAHFSGKYRVIFWNNYKIVLAWIAEVIVWSYCFALFGYRKSGKFYVRVLSAYLNFRFQFSIYRGKSSSIKVAIKRVCFCFWMRFKWIMSVDRLIEWFKRLGVNNTQKPNEFFFLCASLNSE